MVDVMRACGPDEFDVFILALMGVRKILQFDEGACALQLSVNSTACWKRRFLAGELDEGTALLSKLRGILKVVLALHTSMLSNAVHMDLHATAHRLSSVLISCTDFDDTCTVMDTTELLVGITGNAMRWAHLMDEVAFHEEEHLPLQDGEDLLATLLALEAAEQRVDQQVISEGLLTGICDDDIEQVARQRVTLHPNCPELLHRLGDENVPIHVMSTNWSSHLIRVSLAQHLKHLTVHCNDLQYDSYGVCDGRVSRLVCGAGDKEQILSQAVRNAYSGGERNSVAFVGDSINDLLALLEADLGIVLGNDALLQDILSRYKIDFTPLPHAASLILQAVVTEGEFPSFRGRGRLFYAIHGWEEIEQCLFVY